MVFREVLPSLNAAFSRVSVYRTLQMLLGEAGIVLVPEEEGAALLVEVPDSNRTYRGKRSEVVKGQRASLEPENDDGQSNNHRGFVPDKLSVWTVFESLLDSIQHI
jgi:hypothetical protein